MPTEAQRFCFQASEGSRTPIKMKVRQAFTSRKETTWDDPQVKRARLWVTLWNIAAFHTQAAQACTIRRSRRSLFPAMSLNQCDAVQRSISNPLNASCLNESSRVKRCTYTRFMTWDIGAKLVKTTRATWNTPIFMSGI